MSDALVFIGKAGMEPTRANIEAMVAVRDFAPRLILGAGMEDAIKAAMYAEKIAAFLSEMKRSSDRELDFWMRRLRRRRGYRPETPARSAMHAAYRGKTRRRGRK